MIIFFRKNKLLKLALLLALTAIVTFMRSGVNIVAKDNNDTVLKDSELLSKSCCVMDGSNGRVLYSKNGEDPMANASTTKILTCIIALENSNLEDMVEVSEAAAKEPEVKLGLKVGVRYRLKDLLYAMMLESFNDCAYAIAEHVGGSVDSFSKMMNTKAKELGCENTYFITPNGLDAEDGKEFHHTTACDLAIIMKYCTWDSPASELFLKITQTQNYSFEANGKNNITNHNRMLNEEGYLSGKTGYTSKAGYCYIASWEKDGKKLVVALLGCGWPNNKSYKWRDTEKLINYADNKYEMSPVSEQIVHLTTEIPRTHFGESSILEMETKWSDIVENKCLISKGDKIKYDYKLENVELPITKGQKVGTVTYYIEEKQQTTIPIYALESLEKWDFFAYFKVIFNEFF